MGDYEDIMEDQKKDKRVAKLEAILLDGYRGEVGAAFGGLETFAYRLSLHDAWQELRGLLAESGTP